MQWKIVQWCCKERGHYVLHLKERNSTISTVNIMEDKWNYDDRWNIVGERMTECYDRSLSKIDWCVRIDQNDLKVFDASLSWTIINTDDSFRGVHVDKLWYLRFMIFYWWRISREFYSEFLTSSNNKIWIILMWTNHLYETI
jgi:hypothetical protein